MGMYETARCHTLLLSLCLFPRFLSDCVFVSTVSIKKLTVAWDVLTPHRSDLADTMIKDAIQASASEVEEIQQFAERIYVEMIKSEFESTHSLDTVETYTVCHMHLVLWSLRD